ncbi:MAG: ABC transporter permease [Oscillospiraceae bacterium]|nr:ABC transporter permease [Oscillospiraceae bacterium]
MRQKKINWSELVPLILMIVLFVVLALFSKGKLLKAKAIESILNQSMGYIIGALGMLFVMAMGQVDMSMGVNVCVSATVAWLLVGDYGWLPMIIVCCLVGTVIGAINGILSAVFDVDTFMITIAMQIGLRGLINVYFQNSETGRIVFTKQILAFDKVPIKLTILIIFVLLVVYLFEFHPFGYRCRAIGENVLCAHESGIDVKKTKILAFMLAGFFAGLAALFLCCRTGGMTRESGTGFEMRILLGMFLGGMPVAGGMDSRIYKLLIGIPGIMIILSGLNMIKGVGTGGFQLIEALILLAILLLSRIIKQAMYNKDIVAMAKALSEDEKRNPGNL